MNVFVRMALAVRFVLTGRVRPVFVEPSRKIIARVQALMLRANPECLDDDTFTDDVEDFYQRANTMIAAGLMLAPQPALKHDSLMGGLLAAAESAHDQGEPIDRFVNQARLLYMLVALKHADRVAESLGGEMSDTVLRRFFEACMPEEAAKLDDPGHRVPPADPDAAPAVIEVRMPGGGGFDA